VVSSTKLPSACNVLLTTYTCEEPLLSSNELKLDNDPRSDANTQPP
jgi:hypothetical protein